MTVRTKITLWFSAAMIALLVAAYLVITGVSNQVIQKTIRDNLIETVENNADEVEFFASLDDISESNDVDNYMRYKSGYLEIDDDFLSEVNRVYTAVYNESGTLMYGENPIAKQSGALGFQASILQKVSADGVEYYVFDHKMTTDGLEGLWLRGVVSEEQGNVQMAAIFRTSIVLLALLAVLGILGGYLLAGRMLRPIRKISDSAAQITEGGDLNRRIELGDGNDELHALADNFNEMFARLDKSFQTQQQFISDASHELRTPMSVIMAQCELSLDGEHTNEEYRDALSLINRQGRKMTRLISDMLDFTRLELKAQQYEKSYVNLSELTSSVCSDMQLIRENGIELEFAVQEGVTVRGNRDLITRLITNLISNAYRYGRQGGFIKVQLSAENGLARLSVRDNGIGISEGDKSKVFDRFYQADPSRSSRGTGLGLAMVREIAAFHGGRVTLSSTLGEGSEFVFEISEKGEN